MKIQITAAAILFFIGLIFSTNSYSQCDPEAIAEQCIPKLDSGFSFLKSYPIDAEDGTRKMIEYSYVFTQGTEYMISLCAEGDSADGIAVNIFDSNRQMIVSNKSNGEYITPLAFPCNNTGIYYIQYSFDDSSAKCGGSALGFKR